MRLVVCTSWSAKVPDSLFLFYTISSIHFPLKSSLFRRSNTKPPQYIRIVTDVVSNLDAKRRHTLSDKWSLILQNLSFQASLFTIGQIVPSSFEPFLRAGPEVAASDTVM